MYDNSDFDKYIQRRMAQTQRVNPQPEAPSSRMTAPSHRAEVPRRKRSKGNWRVVLFFALCLMFASAAGFAGGLLAGNLSPAAVITEAPAIHNQNDGSGINAPMLAAMPGAPAAVHETPDYAPNAPETDSERLISTALMNVFANQPLTHAEAAAMVRDSVVEIKTERVTAGMWGVQRVAEGAGSGVVISEDGFIITNNHVISNTQSITVRLSDGREFDAHLIAADARTDIAIIRISAQGLTPAVFGDSDELVVGQSALAVGNPLGELGGTVTSGIISALDRDIVLEGEIMTLLQTDAAVNPGNSGGGLFNLHGELIGVVVAKSGGINIEGLGFAIPSNTSRQVASDLIIYGYVRGRACVGLELVDIQTAQLARRYNVSHLGLYILASEYEGLLRGDRIIAVNDRQIANQLGFSAALRDRSVGETVDITVVRAGQEVTVAVVLTQWTP